MKLLKLIVEDIVEADGPIGHEKYKIYPMEYLDCYLEYIEEEFGILSKLDSGFNKEHNWFVNDKKVTSISDEELKSFLIENEEGILELYSMLEIEHTMYNRVEVRAEILKDNLCELDDLDIESEEVNIIYQDIDIECIAEMLTEVSLRQLKDKLSYYGTWQVNKVDDTIYLIDYAGN